LPPLAALLHANVDAVGHLDRPASAVLPANRDNLAGGFGVMNGVASPGDSRATSSYPAGFDAFALRASPSLLRSAYVLTGDRGHAEDLLQTTLWRTARRWRAARVSPEAYAHRVLVNLSRDRRRGLRRRPVEQPGSDGRSDVGADPLERLIARDTMTRAVRRLPVRQREVVVLRFFLDLSVAETAAALGVSEGAVKSHTARALGRMRDLLTDRHAVSGDVSAEVRHAD
jgi:RNA polymerase sigma-70 factor (sigma-E family)